MIAVVLVRGTVMLSNEVKDTLGMLNLTRKNSCVLIDDNPSMKGMVTKVKDFITWGEVNEEVTKQIKAKMKNKVAHLQPPKGGFERKGIKVPFNSGGALGYRGDKINDLLKRMLW